MTFEVSHWSGRLGNNVQQVANCIMAAEKYQSTFMQKLDHDIISNYTVDFNTMTDISQWNGKGRYYSGNHLFTVRRVYMREEMRQV